MEIILGPYTVQKLSGVDESKPCQFCDRELSPKTERISLAREDVDDPFVFCTRCARQWWHSMDRAELAMRREEAVSEVWGARREELHKTIFFEDWMTDDSAGPIGKA